MTEMPVLTEIEARILGCLIEKEATTPDVYPMTANAVMVAANQKTSREPVMSLEPGTVQHTLRKLETDGWVRSQFSARADRYAHSAETKLGITRPQLSLLALLMLRGAQTVHELMTRSERMSKFDEIEAVQHALDRLTKHEPPLVALMPRRSGQREDRYRQLLSNPAFDDVHDDEDAEPARDAAPGLRERVEALEQRVQALEAMLAINAGIENTD